MNKKGEMNQIVVVILVVFIGFVVYQGIILGSTSKVGSQVLENFGVSRCNKQEVVYEIELNLQRNIPRKSIELLRQLSNCLEEENIDDGFDSKGQNKPSERIAGAFSYYTSENPVTNLKEATDYIDLFNKVKLFIDQDTLLDKEGAYDGLKKSYELIIFDLEKNADPKKAGGNLIITESRILSLDDKLDRNGFPFSQSEIQSVYDELLPIKIVFENLRDILSSANEYQTYVKEYTTLGFSNPQITGGGLSDIYKNKGNVIKRTYINSPIFSLGRLLDFGHSPWIMDLEFEGDNHKQVTFEHFYNKNTGRSVGAAILEVKTKNPKLKKITLSYFSISIHDESVFVSSPRDFILLEGKKKKEMVITNSQFMYICFDEPKIVPGTSDTYSIKFLTEYVPRDDDPSEYNCQGLLNLWSERFFDLKVNDNIIR